MRSPLYDLHKRLGAKFVDVDGCEVAADFGDPIAEHHVVRNSIGLLDRSARARIAVKGEDRFTWLQGMVSNDLNLLRERPVIQACILNPTGHLLAECATVKRGDDLLLDLPLSTRLLILAQLEQFIIAEDVEL